MTATKQKAKARVVTHARAEQLRQWGDYLRTHPDSPQMKGLRAHWEKRRAAKAARANGMGGEVKQDTPIVSNVEPTCDQRSAHASRDAILGECLAIVRAIVEAIR